MQLKTNFNKLPPVKIPVLAVLHITQLVGSHCGGADCEIRRIVVVVAIYPGVDIRGFDKIKKLGSKCFIQYISHILFGVMHESGDMVSYHYFIIYITISNDLL